MAGNTFGRFLRLTTFGESHGTSIGGILDGVPAGLALDEAEIQRELDRRKPGQGLTSTKRQEADQIQIQSGLFKGITTGTPLAFIILNTNQHSSDYENLKDIFRPGHADYTYWKKYAGIRDYRGGGRASGRETAARVAAGAIAAQILKPYAIEVLAGSIELGGLNIPLEERDLEGAYQREYFAASANIIPAWNALVEEARNNQDTLGGIVEIVAKKVPAGLGEPVFDKISALLAHALMSVGAVKGVEIGEGFAAARLKGSQNNDALLPTSPHFASNHAGGILGGITTGQDLIIRCAIKPIASIAQTQKTIDLKGQPCEIKIKGRHDLSAIPRVVPVLKAMTYLVLADLLIQNEALETLQNRFQNLDPL
ncbi:MAG: chorismate synthase [Desulfovibrionaceae bacterium]|nr:chorismate synthase [Desulfovibrionaceae bacterium]